MLKKVVKKIESDSEMRFIMHCWKKMVDIEDYNFE